MKRILVVLCFFGAGVVYAEDVEKPSMDILEFIGEWESKDGQWQDPMQFKDMDETDLQQAQTGTTPVSVQNDEVKGHEK